MLDVIRSDYVRTARAKGLSGWTVTLKHVVRNGILPIVTLLGTSLPILIGGSPSRSSTSSTSTAWAC